MPLFPVIPNPPAPVVGAASQSAAQRPTILLRFDTPVGPDFGYDSAGRLVLADKQQSWMQAGLAACLTERGAFPVFPRWFGWRIERALHADSRPLAESGIKRGIIYCWMRCTSGRTARVDGFRFVWGSGGNGDQVEVHFRATPVPGLGLRPTTLAVVL